MFQQFIKQSAGGRRRTSSGKKITNGTITGYRYALQLLLAYEKEHNLQLRICLLHRASLRLLKQEKNYWSRFFQSFLSFLFVKKGYADNYVSTVLKIIKTFFNYLQHDKGYVIGSFHKKFRIPVMHTTPVVLTPEQLQFLITDKQFENSLSIMLKKVKDIFVFGCTVGLRISDLMSLKKTNIITADGAVFLSVITKKTGAEVRIPLPDYIIEIIKRNKRKTGKYLLPRLSGTNLNIQIKQLIKAAGWNSVLPKYLSRNGKIIELKTEAGSSWPFYKHITAHTMRRTAITTMLIMGVPEQVVRKMSGHAAGSKEFYKYVNLAQDYMSKELSKAYQKLVTMTKS